MGLQSTLPQGGATNTAEWKRKREQLQSTLPQGGATENGMGRRDEESASIHAPTRGSDPFDAIVNGETDRFNPRSHKGERQQFCLILSLIFLNCY